MKFFSIHRTLSIIVITILLFSNIAASEESARGGLKKIIIANLPPISKIIPEHLINADATKITHAIALLEEARRKHKKHQLIQKLISHLKNAS